MKNKKIKMMFLFFSLLILLFGTVSATDTSNETEINCVQDTIQDTDISESIVPHNQIVEKNDQIINKTNTKKSNNQIPTKITINPIETTQYTNNVTISGNYKDITGRILRYTPLNVKINTNSYRIQTDVNGNFIEKFRTNTVGTNTVTINYPGNTKFEGNTTTKTFTVTRQDTNITINTLKTTEYSDYLTITGKYTDKNGVNLRYTPITLNINGIKYTTTTNNYGEYIFNYKTNKVGYNSITASYPGNMRYQGTQYSTYFYVTTKSTLINLDPIESKSVASIIRFTGNYEDTNGKKLRYTPLNININGLKYTTKTDYYGEFALNYQTRNVGENKIIISYPGNGKYSAATTESTFEVTSKATKITVQCDDYIQYTNHAYIYGSFFDCDENPLIYTTLNLNINGKNYYTKTDREGYYYFDKYKSNQLGINNVTVSYSGNTKYDAQSSSSTFIVTPKDTILTINPDYDYNPIYNTESAIITFEGNFTDSSGNPLRYTPLQIDIDGKKYSTKTNDYGKYTFSFKSEYSDENQITVSYNGNSRYYGTSVKDSFGIRITQLYLNDINEAKMGDYIDVKGWVNNNLKLRLINIPVTITVNGEKYNTIVNEEGYFNLKYQVKKMGVNNITARYDGNYKYASSSKTIRFIADRIPTRITISNTLKQPNGYTMIKGQFYDYRGNMLRYTPLTLNIDGIKYTTQTNQNGLFTFNYDGNPNIQHSLIASYAGNAKYDSTETQIFFKAQTQENKIEILTPHTKEYYYENDHEVLCKENYEDINICDTVHLGSDIIFGFTTYVEGQMMPGTYIEQNGLIIEEEAPANTITNVEFYYKSYDGDSTSFIIYPEWEQTNIFDSELIKGYIPYKAVITYHPKTPTEIREYYTPFDYPNEYQ